MRILTFHPYEAALVKAMGQINADWDCVFHHGILRQAPDLQWDRVVLFMPDRPPASRIHLYEELKPVIARCRHVVTCSEFSWGKLTEWLGREVHLLHYIPINTELLHRRADKQKVERVPNQICCVTRWAPHKRVELLFAACGSLKSHHQLVISTRMNTCPEGAADVEKFRMMSASRVGVCPSDYEGFSMSPGEYAVSGAVPIISDIPTHREIYPSFPYFKAGDVQDLARKLVRALDGEFDSLVQTWSDFVRERYALDVVAPKVRKFLEELE